MTALRPYQQRCVDAVLASPSRSVCVVAPTGAGKTVIAQALLQARAPRRTAFIVHRSELLRQTAERLRATFGAFAVGCIAPGYDWQPHARIQVAMVQTLLARGHRPEVDDIIVDECHHLAADVSWTAVLQAYPESRIVGLTATPQRQDGQPLGDVFSHLVVAAQYSELINDGHLVPCRVFQPPVAQAGTDIALDPLTAYQRYAPGTLAFGFAPTVKLAKRWAEQFTAAGIPSDYVSATSKGRVAVLERFKRGEIMVLWNMNVLTEGVDVPQAQTLINARKLGHVGAYLQACGRVLRPYPGKSEAIILDLTGATLEHGFPTEDRDYTLTGKGIARSTVPPLRNCLQCGATLHAHLMRCPECGYVFAKRDPRIPHIYSLELKEVYAGRDTTQDAKSREYQRLRQLGRDKGWSPSWVVREYAKLFREQIVISDATPEEKADELKRLRERQHAAGYKLGWVAYRFKATFGHFPAR